jgi:hypothetical protein
MANCYPTTDIFYLQCLTTMIAVCLFFFFTFFFSLQMFHRPRRAGPSLSCRHHASDVSPDTSRPLICFDGGAAMAAGNGCGRWLYGRVLAPAPSDGCDDIAKDGTTLPCVARDVPPATSGIGERHPDLG